jgi:cytochrome c oxidase cbb3-type subunit I/II
MVRPFRSETARYGEYSKAGEFVYDHPFLWGSKRTGPDLHRVGGKYLNSWHYYHMKDPTIMSPGSIMPRYPWLLTNRLDFESITPKMKAMATLGVPYDEDRIAGAAAEAQTQAEGIAANLNLDENIEVLPSDEIVALIAYLQRLGTDIKVAAN